MEKYYSTDGSPIIVNIYEQDKDKVVVSGDTEKTIIKIYEPGGQGSRGIEGPSGSSGNIPSNLISSSAQIASDISGSFYDISQSLSDRISVYDSKSIISSSQQLGPTGIYSGSGNINTDTIISISGSVLTFSGSLRLNSSFSISSSVSQSYLSSSFDVFSVGLNPTTGNQWIVLNTSDIYVQLGDYIGHSASFYDPEIFNSTGLSGSFQIVSVGVNKGNSYIELNTPYVGNFDFGNSRGITYTKYTNVNNTIYHATVIKNYPLSYNSNLYNIITGSDRNIPDVGTVSTMISQSINALELPLVNIKQTMPTDFFTSSGDYTYIRDYINSNPYRKGTINIYTPPVENASYSVSILIPTASIKTYGYNLKIYNFTDNTQAIGVFSAAQTFISPSDYNPAHKSDNVSPFTARPRILNLEGVEFYSGSNEFAWLWYVTAIE